MIKNKLTNEEFIEICKQKHNNKYDYSKTNYINSQTKITITCPIHGDFEQKAYAHKHGQGCPKCAKSIKITTEQWIEKAIKIHGNKYDYSKSKYTGTHNNIVIICHEHGEFQQKAYSHLNGQGCPKCANKVTSNDDFIEKARRVHGDKYDYSLVNYKGVFTPIRIICPIHGEFEQKPRDHVQGCGCSKCAGNNKLTTETFIEKAHKIHGNKYDYSKVNYINNYTKVCIICPEHGEFWMKPNNHINGQEQGCPKCSESHGEKFIRTYFVNNNIEFERNYIIDIDKSINKSGTAKIDFYVPKYNLAIEYNGQQHYIPMGFSGGQIAFEHQQKRDQYIRDYCNNNKIKLLEISYEYNTQEKINNILNNFFENL